MSPEPAFSDEASTRPPSLLNQSIVAQPGKGERRRCSVPLAASRSTTSPKLPEARQDPSGENATAVMRLMWPLTVKRSRSDSQSQQDIVLSARPAATDEPSAEKQRDVTHRVSPLNTLPSAPVSGSKDRTEQSPHPTNISPLSEKQRERALVLSALKVLVLVPRASKTSTIPRSIVHTMCVPQGLVPTLTTWCVRHRDQSGCPLSTSHTRSDLSSDPVMRSLESREKHTSSTTPECPTNVRPIDFVARSRITQRLSYKLPPMPLPSGDQAMAKKKPVSSMLPSAGAFPSKQIFSSPVNESHTRIVLSFDTLAMRVPSGEKSAMNTAEASSEA
mmetsp:Transcript_66271/g.158115  ORF Transcript_66271/g.158115 Transcript_66271/m.158115 type:complete len:332 (-) Transcript_66271:169-1164(-)